MELSLGDSNRTVEVVPYFQKGLCSNGSFTCTGVMGAVKNMTADIGLQRGVLQVRKPGLLFFPSLREETRTYFVQRPAAAKANF